LRAVILAAGKGQRLKNITGEIPKPMIIYEGKPILEHNILLCKKYGIKEIFINTHHLSEQITEYFKDGTDFGVKIFYTFENELLGTSGAVKNISIVYNNFSETDFFVIYGDNISNCNLSLLEEKFKSVDNPSGVIAFHHREDVAQSGVAEFDENNKIINFIEKPGDNYNKSHWVNAGVYYLNKNILNEIPEGFSDFGKDIFPKILSDKNSLYGVFIEKDLIAIDTPELYKKNIQN